MPSRPRRQNTSRKHDRRSGGSRPKSRPIAAAQTQRGGGRQQKTGRRRGARGAQSFRTPALVEVFDVAERGSKEWLTAGRAFFALAALAGPEIVAELAQLAAPLAAEELDYARDACVHFLAAQNGFRGDRRRDQMTTETKCLFALEEANLTKLAETGEPLDGVDDYRHAPDDAPSLSTLYRLFRSWEGAKEAAGLNSTGQARVRPLRPQGRAASKHKFSFEERIAALARGIEFNHGRTVSHEFWDDVRAAVDYGMPSTGVITGRNTKNATLHWDKAHWHAYQHIRARPHLYPRTTKYLRRRDAAGLSDDDLLPNGKRQ